MPRKWTNYGSGGYGTHRWTEPTPVIRAIDLRIVDEILAMNARIAGAEKNEKKRLRRKKRK